MPDITISDGLLCLILAGIVHGIVLMTQLKTQMSTALKRLDQHDEQLTDHEGRLGRLES